MTSHHSSLGAAFDPLHVQLEALPDFYVQLRQEEPITFCPALNAYLVSRYDDIRSVLLQPNLFLSKNTPISRLGFYPQTVAELKKGYPFEIITYEDGERHLRLMKPLAKTFSPTRVQTMEPIIRKIATKLIDSFESDGQVEIISQFARPLPREVILTMIGVPQQDMATVRKQYEDLHRLTLVQLSQEEQVECARQFVALQHYFAHLIEEKQNKLEGEDLISELVRDSETGEQPLSHTDLINQIVGIMIAASETIAQLIGNGLVLVLEEPTRWQTLCEHPEAIPLLIEETLRLRSPVHGLVRTTAQQVTIGGVTMPQGTKLILLCASANHDESQFVQARRCEMQRQPNPHLTFGHGLHSCVGATLARLEGCIAFEALTQRLPQMRLVPNRQSEYYFRIAISGHKQLFIQWD
jgi:cytochrome P450